MIIVYRYSIERTDEAVLLRVRNLDAPLCPDCGSLCSGYDTRLRYVVSDDGKTTTYRLRRVRCPVCKILHLELPDFMRPRKHYAASVINKAVEGDTNCPADSSTIWRWQNKK